MCRCNPIPFGPRRTLWRRFIEWMCGDPESNNRRARAYFMAQLCRLSEHRWVDVAEHKARKCEWCGVVSLVPPNVVDQVMRAWSGAFGADATEQMRIASFLGTGTKLSHAPEDQWKGALAVRPRRVSGADEAIRSMRGCRMSGGDADRILRELVKRAPLDWAATGPLVVPKRKRSKKPRRGR